MFSKLAFIASIAMLATATPTPNEPASSCTTGSLQCCDSSGAADSPAVAPILSSIGVVVQDVSVLVGVTCTPITVIGVSGTSCAAQSLCCDDDSFKGVVAVGCTPVSL